MLSWLHFLIVFAVAFAATALLVPVVRRFAIAHGIVDEPGPRRVNKKPIPRMGGVAMLGGLLVAIIFEGITEVLGVWSPVLASAAGGPVQLVGILVGMCVVVGVGIADDVMSLRPQVKFGGQIVAALIIALTGTTLSNFMLPFSTHEISLGVLEYPITVIYLVCFINVINLIDGLDGLAAGITAISSITLFFMMMTLSNYFAAFFAFILVAVCLGFLLYNFNPASIFMGDSGSMLLGLLMGTVSLLGMLRFASVTMMLVPIIVALVPIIDTLAAIIRRTRAHQPIQSPDAGHLHHRLLRAGFSQRKAVLIVYLWTAVLCIGAIVIWEFGGAVKWTVLVVLFVVSLVIVRNMGLFGPVRQRHGRRDVVYDTKGVDPEPEDKDA